eukprot:195759_1
MQKSKMLIMILIFLCTYLSATAGYHCWDESERTASLTFTNNPNRTMTHLPTIKLMQGYYGSQFAMQYAAYVYLKEKQGVDVVFYPDNDPNALFDRYAGYISSNWCGVNNATTCIPHAPYPQFYFEEIKHDNYDLLMEIWDIAVEKAGGSDYFRNEEVLYGGISGVYGEGGWFVPSYLYRDHPSWILPSTLRDDDTVRQAFIDAYTIQSDNNYLDVWQQIWGDNLQEYEQYGFGIPDDVNPIIFGSYGAYAISSHSSNLANHALDTGINWTFVAFGSEGRLSSFVQDLYAKRLPFIANLYSPHPDFATQLDGFGEYMQFERIALQRNPSNSVQAECYVNGKCTFPVTSLQKLGNPRLVSKFPEMENFLYDFQMTANDVNDLTAYHTNASSIDSSLTEHELWMTAACKWLKETEATANEWYQEIIRYDCIFDEANDENNNCGFNYYYNTLQDAQNNQNRISKPWYDSVGGECMNSTLFPLCSCSNEYFAGQSCRESCPGIIGPIYNDNGAPLIEEYANESMIAVDKYVVYVCNAQGTCNMKQKRCDCELGYGGNDCAIKYELFEYDTTWFIVWVALYSVCIALLIMSILWVHCNRRYSVIKAMAPPLTILFTCGMITLCAGSIVQLVHPLDDASCIIENYLYGVGAIITIMVPLVKLYRVAVIFAEARNFKTIDISDWKLVQYIVFAVVIEVILCTVYAVLHQMNGGVEVSYQDDLRRIEYVCNRSDNVSYVVLTNYVYILGLWHFMLCFTSFKNRNSNESFKESKCVYFGSFFSIFVCYMVMIFHFVSDDMFAIITIQSGAMLIILCVIWVLFYWTRMLNFFKYPDARESIARHNCGSPNASANSFASHPARSQSDKLVSFNKSAGPSVL